VSQEIVPISKRSIGALRVLLAASVLIPAVLFSVAAWQNWVILFDEASQRTVKTAVILERHAAATMQIYELVFSRVEDFLRNHNGHADPQELQPFLRQLDEDAGQIDGIFLIDADGNVTAHSRFSSPQHITTADRDYFLAVKDKGDRIFVGAPITGRLSGEPRLNIGYRLQSPDGRFIGALGISVSESHFADFYRTVRESAADVTSLVRADGVVLARSPPFPPDRGLKPNPLFTANVEKAENGVMRRSSRLDGIERIYAFRRIGDYPIYVTYGLDVAGVTHSWHINLIVYAVIALPAALTLLLVVWTALKWARQEAAAATLLRTEIAQRTAAELRRDEAEAALRQAQKMEAIGQMTGGVAHDFNNLLTVIIGNLDTAASSAGNAPELTKPLGTALKAAERGGVLTQQLLAFARRQMLRPEVIIPNRLIEDFGQLIAQAAGEAVKVRTILAPTLAPCRIDRAQFEAAMLNLVVNARDAMNGVGQITIETRNLEISAEEAGRIPELKPGSYVLVTVTDTGQGMSPEVLEHAFEPFYTTKEVGRGSGLGLSMVYGFVKQSGGHVTIASTVGAGTTVRIFLPRSIELQPSTSPGLIVGDDLPGGSESILLVEDNEEVLEIAAGMLGQLGYQVAIAHDANEALAVLQTSRPIDAVFTDIVMPGGMTGDQLAVAAVKMRPGLKVLLTTGYAAQITGSRTASAGGFPLIAKPYRRNELALKLREVLRPAGEDRALMA
jgi:signal transduction histidine kinase/CheY-like chemotaxis protein